MTMKDFRGREPVQGPAHDWQRGGCRNPQGEPESGQAFIDGQEAQRAEEAWFRLKPWQRSVVDLLTDTLRVLEPGDREAASLLALRKANQRTKPKPEPTPKAAPGGAWLYAEGRNEPVFISAEHAAECRREYAALKAQSGRPDFWVSGPVRQHEQGS
jgi:hypothetical protein